jgi:hypothetical protein
MVVMILGVCATLGIFIYCSDLREYSKNFNLCLNSAQEKMEEILALPSRELMTTYYNCHVPNEYQRDECHFNIAGLPSENAHGRIYVTRYQEKKPGSVRDDLLKIRIVVCWRQKNGRIIGSDNGGKNPDKALDGIVRPSVFEEKVNVDGQIISPCSISTFVAVRPN